MKTAIYEPKGIRFFDRRNDREMLLVGDDEPQAGCDYDYSLNQKNYYYYYYFHLIFQSLYVIHQ